MTDGSGSLLLVDDVEENLVALEAALEPLGHRMVLARSGEEALRHLLRDEDFAAVILDVQMPGIDGFQTAEAIRQRERTENVPILFLTAINRDDVHRLRGFAAGAADYIFKPVDPEVLRAKVGVFVRLHAAELELRRQGDDLRRQAADLARSNSDLDQFASVVSHDLLDPLSVITGYLELLSDRLGDGLEPDCREWIARIDECARRMHDLVGELLAYSRSVSDDTAGTTRPPTPLGDSLADAVANLAPLVAQTGSVVETEGELPVVTASRQELTRVLQNLIANSILHSGQAPVRTAVSAQVSAAEVTIRVSDDGPGVPPEQMERLFGVFERAGTGPSPHTGLGLSICRRIVNRLGGRIWMEPNPDRGLSVLFTLPSRGPK